MEMWEGLKALAWHVATAAGTEGPPHGRWRAKHLWPRPFHGEEGEGGDVNHWVGTQHPRGVGVLVGGRLIAPHLKHRFYSWFFLLFFSSMFFFALWLDNSIPERGGEGVLNLSVG